MSHKKEHNKTLGALVDKLAKANYGLWHSQDLSSARDDHEDAETMRMTMQLNKERNNLIEAIDDHIIKMLNQNEK